MALEGFPGNCQVAEKKQKPYCATILEFPACSKHFILSTRLQQVFFSLISLNLVLSEGLLCFSLSGKLSFSSSSWRFPAPPWRPSSSTSVTSSLVCPTSILLPQTPVMVYVELYRNYWEKGTGNWESWLTGTVFYLVLLLSSLYNIWDTERMLNKSTNEWMNNWMNEWMNDRKQHLLGKFLIPKC